VLKQLPPLDSAPLTIAGEWQWTSLRLAPQPQQRQPATTISATNSFLQNPVSALKPDPFRQTPDAARTTRLTTYGRRTSTKSSQVTGILLPCQREPLILSEK
jgi:hypothetical protein